MVGLVGCGGSCCWLPGGTGVGAGVEGAGAGAGVVAGGVEVFLLLGNGLVGVEGV